MDRRTELRKNERLHFPGMECVVEKTAGQGSNVIAYLGHYADSLDPGQSHSVLIRELFPFDPRGGIYREADGSIHVEEASRFLFEMNRTSFLRGNEVHLTLARKHPSDVDVHINTFEYKGTLYSLLGFSGGRSLEQELRILSGIETPALLRVLRIMEDTLESLRLFHESGYLHLDISPDNILLTGKKERERVTLIDYNSVHTMEEIKGDSEIYYSTKGGYTAPEVLKGVYSEVGPWTDLYSMTAVLYHCIFRKKLDPLQAVGILPIMDVEAPMLYSCPETALSMLRKILRKGLSVTVDIRYRNTEEMLTDIRELQNRVEGKGITHWALWESGRRRLLSTMKDNIAYNYIWQEETLYPLYVMGESGNKTAVEGWAAELSGRKPVLLLGGGGMGKTTSLLRIACTQPVHYSRSDPAVLYLSLYGYRDSGEYYLRDSILSGLDFTPDTESWESARRELVKLLDASPYSSNMAPQEPSQVGSPFQKAPVLLSQNSNQQEGGAFSTSLLLLLDGLNEASGNTKALLREIHLLAGLKNVQIILTSRSDTEDDLFSRHRLCRLEPGDIRGILSHEGILPPESAEVFDLLGFPLLLSMYILTVRETGSQQNLSSREQLLGKYIDALLEKEASRFPEEAVGIEGVVFFLLPEIAALSIKKQSALSTAELSGLTEKCFSEFSEKALYDVYPQWTGCREQLRFSARDANEWFGRAIRDILWKRMGLLICDKHGTVRTTQVAPIGGRLTFQDTDSASSDSQSSYRILHQVVEDYLDKKSRAFHEKFDKARKKRLNWRRVRLLSAALIIVSMIACWSFFMNGRLLAQQNQILKNESLALASSSRAALKAGNREKALREALSALPSKDSKRPYVAAAEGALADALFLYQDDAYHPYRTLSWENTLVRAVTDEEGNFFVGVDKYGKIFCLDCGTGEKLWETLLSDSFNNDSYFFNTYYSETGNAVSSELEYPILKYIKKRKAVFYAGQKGEAVLFSVLDGKELWRITYDDCQSLQSGLVYFADISHDENTLIIGTDIKGELHTLYFDMENGTQTYDSFIDLPSNGNLSFTPYGLFTENDQIYIALIVETDLSDIPKVLYYLGYIDVATGDVKSLHTYPAGLDDCWGKSALIRSVIQESASEGMSSTVSSTESRVPLSDDNNNRDYSSGTYFYLSEYDVVIQNGTYWGCAEIGFLQDDSQEWAFKIAVDLLPEPSFLPEMIVNEGKLYLFSGNEIMEVSQDGTVIRFKTEHSIVHAFLDEIEQEKRVFLLFDNGQTGFMSFPRLGIRINEQQYSINAENRLFGSAGPGKYKKPFCAIVGNEAQTAEVWQYQEARPTKYILDHFALEQLNLDSGAVCTLPEGEEYIIINKMLNEETSNSDSTSKENRYIVFRLNTKGDVLDSFLFEAEDFDLSAEMSLTSNGMKLLFGHFFIDLNTHMLINLDNTVPEGVRSSYLCSAALGDSIYSACLDEERLILYEDGVYKDEMALDEDFQFSSINYSGVFGDTFHPFRFCEMIFGSNGYILLLGTDGSTVSYMNVEGNPVDYFLIYSKEHRSWIKIRNHSYDKAFPAVCSAHRDHLFASYDRDRRLLIYDIENEAVVQDFHLGVDPMDIVEMSFILDDRYILIRSNNNHSQTQCQIVRLEDGKDVFLYTQPEVKASGKISVYDDKPNHRIYLFNGVTGRMGLCIDSDSWERLFEIPNLRSVTKDGICLTCNLENEYMQYPLFTRNDIIEMGFNVLSNSFSSSDSLHE